MESGNRPLAGVELGGTKCIAVLGRGSSISAREQIPTTTPAETMARLADLLGAWRRSHDPAALGIGSFGPIRIDPAAPDYGHMLATPKPGWRGADVVGPLAAIIPTHRLHTDVTAAALAEGAAGAAKGLTDFVYVTIGTGVGMGIIAGGAPITGVLHPEAGHVHVRRVPGDTFAGVCPSHGDCVEGLISGPAVAARFGDHLPPNENPRWEPVADAIAESFAQLLLTLATARIVVGGGVGLGRPHLLARARALLPEKLGGYLPHVSAETIDGIIVPAALGGEAGPLGTLALAERALALA